MTLEWIKNNQKQARNLHRIWIFNHCQSKNVKFSLYFSDLSFFSFLNIFQWCLFSFLRLFLAKRGKNQIWICNSQFFFYKTNTESVQTNRNWNSSKMQQKKCSQTQVMVMILVYFFCHFLLIFSFDYFWHLLVLCLCSFFVFFL